MSQIVGIAPTILTERANRSVVKALTYRLAIVCLDFLAIYIFTHKVEVALGFMIVSNVYTTVGYFLHERLWARIAWGQQPKVETVAPRTARLPPPRAAIAVERAARLKTFRNRARGVRE